MTEPAPGFTAALLRKLADAIKSVDEAEWEAIRKGDFRIEIVSRSNGASSRQRGGEAVDSAELVATAEQLKQAPDREAGRAILDERCESKDSLMALARHLDLPYQKRESIDRLKEKIVESTIGFRLRSRAIQGAHGASSNAAEPPDPGSSEPDARPSA